MLNINISMIIQTCLRGAAAVKGIYKGRLKYNEPMKGFQLFSCVMQVFH